MFKPGFVTLGNGLAYGVVRPGLRQGTVLLPRSTAILTPGYGASAVLRPGQRWEAARDTAELDGRVRLRACPVPLGVLSLRHTAFHFRRL